MKPAVTRGQRRQLWRKRSPESCDSSGLRVGDDHACLSYLLGQLLRLRKAQLKATYLLLCLTESILGHDHVPSITLWYLDNAQVRVPSWYKGLDVFSHLQLGACEREDPKSEHGPLAGPNVRRHGDMLIGAILMRFVCSVLHTATTVSLLRNLMASSSLII